MKNKCLSTFNKFHYIFVVFHKNNENKKLEDNEKKYDKGRLISNSIHFHELNSKKEKVKRFTIVTDINGNVIIKTISFCLSRVFIR